MKTRFLYNIFSTNIHLAKILEIMGFFFKGIHQTFKRKRSSIKPMVLYGKERQDSN
jgi:hypothetical protein